jgi:hypothetical protein
MTKLAKILPIRVLILRPNAVSSGSRASASGGAYAISV